MIASMPQQRLFWRIPTDFSLVNRVGILIHCGVTYLLRYEGKNNNYSRALFVKETAMPAYISNSPGETRNLGKSIGESLKGGEIILLHGDLGAGKTLLTKGIAEGLGIEGSVPVVSPSFTLVNIYKARLDIVHVDLYRLNSDEIYDLGLEDYMDQEHVMVVEWAEKAPLFFSNRTFDITIEYKGENSRTISLNSQEPLPVPKPAGSSQK